MQPGGSVQVMGGVRTGCISTEGGGVHDARSQELKMLNNLQVCCVQNYSYQ